LIRTRIGIRSCRRWLPATAVLIWVGSRSASGAALSLADAIALAERQGYDALAAEQLVRSAEADLGAAKRIANPAFSGSYLYSTDVSIGPGETTTASGYALGLSDQGAVDGLVTGKRHLRVRQAEASLGSARHTSEDALRQLRVQVAQAFYSLLAAESAEQVAREVAGSFGRALELVQTRFRYGAVAEGDVARIETAKLEADQTVTSSAAQVGQARESLALLLAVDADTLEVTGSLEGQPPAWLAGARRDQLLADAASLRPDVLAARASLESAEAGLSLARRQRLPDVSLSAGYTREGPEVAPVTPPTISAGASFELPVFHQRQAEIAKAESERVSARIALDRTMARARAEVSSAWAAYQAARELVLRMQGSLLERARRSRELVEYQYRAGAVSLLDLLDAERTLLVVELEYRQDLGQYRTSAAQLAAAVGRREMP